MSGQQALSAAVMGSILLFQYGCGGARKAKDVPFQGTWTFVEENGIILRAITTIYSSQVNSLVTRSTQECQQVQFGAVDAAALAMPPGS